MTLMVEMTLRAVDELFRRAALACELCAVGAPHHTVGESGIGDATRRVVYDLHEIEDANGVGLAECTAYEIWSAF